MFANLAWRKESSGESMKREEKMSLSDIPLAINLTK